MPIQLINHKYRIQTNLYLLNTSLTIAVIKAENYDQAL